MQGQGHITPTISLLVRPSFPMMTITYSMITTMMSCLVAPVCVEVANQSNLSLHHSSPHLRHGYVGPAEVLVVEYSLALRALFLSLRDPVLGLSAALAPL